MRRVSSVQIQTGIATLDDDGESPLIVTTAGNEENTAIIITTTTDQQATPNITSYPLYIVTATASGSSDYHYFVASSS